MDRDEALSAFTFVADLVAELGGGPLPPDVVARVRQRVGEWVAPRLDPDAWARVKFHELLSDLASGRAIVVSGEDGSTSVEW